KRRQPPPDNRRRHFRPRRTTPFHLSAGLLLISSSCNHFRLRLREPDPARGLPFSHATLVPACANSVTRGPDLPNGREPPARVPVQCEASMASLIKEDCMRLFLSLVAVTLLVAAQPHDAAAQGKAAGRASVKAAVGIVNINTAPA